jgi:heptosyltransferase-2
MTLIGSPTAPTDSAAPGTAGFSTTSKRPKANSILVVRYRFIGDTILTVPFLRNLRRAYPHARIDVLVGPQSGEVLAGCPYINELITYDTTRFHKYDSGEGQARSFWSYVEELKKRKYDTAFLLKRSFSSAALAFLIGCKNRIGYGSAWRSFMMTKSVAWDPSIHEVESTLDVLREANIEVTDTDLEAWISAEEERAVRKIIPQLATNNKRKILFHAAAAHPNKEYPLEHWATVMKELAKKEQILPFFTGSSQDFLTYERLIGLAGMEGVNCAGKLSLRESMALLAAMDLSICTDSGPSHLSAAVGTPTLAVFGPTDPERWRPWGSKHEALFDSSLACRPCNYKMSCDNKRQCLTELSPHLIVQKALQMLRADKNAAVPQL